MLFTAEDTTRARVENLQTRVMGALRLATRLQEQRPLQEEEENAPNELLLRYKYILEDASLLKGFTIPALLPLPTTTATVKNLQTLRQALAEYARARGYDTPAPTTGSDTHYEIPPKARTRAALETTSTPTVGTPDQGEPMPTNSPDSPAPTNPPFSLGRQGRPSRFWRAMRRVAWWLTILGICAAGVTAPLWISLLSTGYTPMELYKNHKAAAAAAAAAPDAPVDCTNAFTLDLKGVSYVVIPLHDGAANLYVEGLRLHDGLCYWDDGQTIITNAALTQFRSSFRDAVPTVISSMGMTPPVKVEGSVVMCSPGSGPVANCFEG